MTLSESKNLMQNFNFRGHLSSFRAENTPISGPFTPKNNTQTSSKQLQNKLEKVKKTGFFSQKLPKMTLSESQILTKNSNFRGHLSAVSASN